MRGSGAILRLTTLLAFCALTGALLSSVLVARAATVGNERQEEYRAPWPERYRFNRDGGCGVNDGSGGCGGHVGSNLWAVDMNDYDRAGDADCGDPMKATRNGSANFIPAASSGGYGNLLGINHIAFNGGYTSSWYAHLISPTSSPWDTVFAQGDWVGAEGTTGISTGCHLHFQLDLGFASPLDSHQTSDVVLSGTPGIDGFDLQNFSDNGASPFTSNNTGPGYARFGAPPNQDPGPLDAPLPDTVRIRNYVRNLAVYTVDYGSTKFSTRGPCGANRRWVKHCNFGASGLGWTQGFIAQGFFGDIPRALVLQPGAVTAYSISGHFWKAYSRKCVQGSNTFAYEDLGFPTAEQQGDIQTFQRGTITRTFGPSVIMTVAVNGVGSCTYTSVLDTNNDPCYDVDGDAVISILDLTLLASRFGQPETDPNFNDRYDVDRDGSISILDLSTMASQGIGFSCY